MAKTEQDFPSLPVGKIAIAGSAIGFVSIGLFVGLWFGLQALGVSQLISLMAAICAPIALMMVVMWVVYLNRANN